MGHLYHGYVSHNQRVNPTEISSAAPKQLGLRCQKLHGSVAKAWTFHLGEADEAPGSFRIVPGKFHHWNPWKTYIVHIYIYIHYEYIYIYLLYYIWSMENDSDIIYDLYIIYDISLYSYILYKYTLWLFNSHGSHEHWHVTWLKQLRIVGLLGKSGVEPIKTRNYSSTMGQLIGVCLSFIWPNLLQCLRTCLLSSSKSD